LNQYNKAMPVNHSKECENVMIKSFKICMIQAVPFILLAKKQNYKIFVITMEGIKKALELK
jgi:hypothetical protein